jgi:cysteine desulfurase family protein (TIGR01976 family)
MQFDVNWVRQQFPSLNRTVAPDTYPVFFDNPAGTQVPQVVIDAVSEFYRTMNALPGGPFITSKWSDDALWEARQAVADLLNASRREEIVFGPNMSTLNFNLSRALAKTMQAGDEIVVTRMDHDANISPWLQIAEDNDLVIKWVDIHTEDATLDLDTLEEALSERTRLVATVHASNAVGTINPIRRIADMVHAAGAYHVVDAVQSVPHIPIDVQALGCDFLLCSAYKFFAPHIGIMYGRYELLESLPVYKVRPAKDTVPHRWETGMLSFETIHGTARAINYIADLGVRFADIAPDAPRRERIVGGMQAVQAYETELAQYLITGLNAIEGITVGGITDSARSEERVPTVSFVYDGYKASEVGQYLAEHHIFLWTGHYYAIEIMNRLELPDGMVRIGIAHYNTKEEINRLLDALRQMPNR